MLLAAVRLVYPSVTREQLDDWLETEREQTLTTVYYNPRGFGSIDRTFRDAKRIDPWTSREEVTDVLRAQASSRPWQEGKVWHVPGDRRARTDRHRRGRLLELRRGQVRPRGHRRLLQAAVYRALGEQTLW